MTSESQFISSSSPNSVPKAKRRMKGEDVVFSAGDDFDSVLGHSEHDPTSTNMEDGDDLPTSRTSLVHAGVSPLTLRSPPLGAVHHLHDDDNIKKHLKLAERNVVNANAVSVFAVESNEMQEKETRDGDAGIVGRPLETGRGNDQRLVEREGDILDLDNDASDKPEPLTQQHEGEGKLLDLEEETLDEARPQTEREGDILDLDEETTCETRPRHEGGGDLLDLEEETLSEQQNQREGGMLEETVAPYPQREGHRAYVQEREGSILDLEDETTVGCDPRDGDLSEADQPNTPRDPHAIPEREADMLDFDDMSCSTSDQAPDHPKPFNPIDEKIMKRQIKLGSDPVRQLSSLAEQNERIASKMMGTGSSALAETPEQKKLRDYRQAQDRSAAARQAALARENNRIASKIAGAGAGSKAGDEISAKIEDFRENQNNSNAERQAMLAAENQRTASKMTALGAPTNPPPVLQKRRIDSDLSTAPVAGSAGQTPEETHQPLDAGTIHSQKENDLETGEVPEQNIATAHKVDDVLKTAVGFDPGSKLTIIRNRRFQMYSGLIVFCFSVVALVTLAGLELRDETLPIPYRSTLGIKENLENVLGATVLEDGEGPQRKAMHWIMHKDRLQTTPENPHFVQRFLAACFYFATTEQSEWEFGCAPSEDYAEPNRCQLEVTPEGDDVLAMRWLSGESECLWGGIWCDELGDIRAVRAGAWNITAQVPDDINWYFPSIQQFVVEGNLFEGTLPETFFETPRHLVEVNMGGNLISGSIPESLYHSENLQRLQLSVNSMQGTLSSDIRFSSAMKAFSIMENLLTGTIPPEISSLDSAFVLELRGNMLVGPVPSEVGKCLHVLDLHGNLLSRSIPEALGNATALDELYLSENLLTGSIPAELLSQSTTLGLLAVHANKLQGQLPVQLPATLWYLDVRENEFTGPIPSEWANSSSLLIARFDDNFFEGSIPLCPTDRRVFDLKPLFSLTATCNPQLVCDCCETQCEVLFRENDPVDNLDGSVSNTGSV